MSESDYVNYKEYVLEFFHKYDKDVGKQKLIDNKIQPTQMKILQKLRNVNEVGLEVDKILQKIESSLKTNPFLSPKEYLLLDIIHTTDWIRYNTEALRKFNSMFFLPKDLDKFGNADMWALSKRLGYDKDGYKKLIKCFFIDIRNALSHADYYFDFENKIKLVYVNKNIENKLTIEDMKLIIEKMKVLADVHKELGNYYNPT